MLARLRPATLFAGALFFASIPAAHANITIDGTFDLTGLSASQQTAYENDVDSVISFYESIITNNITVDVTFGTMSSGLGESIWYYGEVSYNEYCTALQNTIGTTAVGETIFGTGGSLGPTCGTNNPVTNNADIDVKVNNLNAVGIAATQPTNSTILVNTDITDAGGCTTQEDGCYAFIPTVEHELDEVLGLGSGLANTTGGTITTFGGEPLPEDLFRYASAGTRSFVTGVSCTSSLAPAYFSIDNGTTDLAGFNEACNGGDWGDWDSASDRVQNAFANPLPSDPALGVEITALEAIGYTFTNPTPEPSAVVLVATALVAILFLRRRASASR